MKDVEKTYIIEYFPAVSITKDSLIVLLENLVRKDESIEVIVGDTVFEGTNEAHSHMESLSFPMEVNIGGLKLKFDSFSNYVSSAPGNQSRVRSAVKELNKFRNPLRWLNSSIGFAFLMFLVWILLAVCSAVIVRLLPFKPEEHQAYGVLFILSIGASFISFRVSKWGNSMLKSTVPDTFIRRNGEKILISVASSLLTAVIFWLVKNWAVLETALGLSM